MFVISAALWAVMQRVKVGFWKPKYCNRFRINPSCNGKAYFDDGRSQDRITRGPNYCFEYFLMYFYPKQKKNSHVYKVRVWYHHLLVAKWPHLLNWVKWLGLSQLVRVGKHSCSIQHLISINIPFEAHVGAQVLSVVSHCIFREKDWYVLAVLMIQNV